MKSNNFLYLLYLLLHTILSFPVLLQIKCVNHCDALKKGNTEIEGFPNSSQEMHDFLIPDVNYGDQFTVVIRRNAFRDQLTFGGFAIIDGYVFPTQKNSQVWKELDLEYTDIIIEHEEFNYTQMRQEASFLNFREEIIFKIPQESDLATSGATGFFPLFTCNNHVFPIMFNSISETIDLSTLVSPDNARPYTITYLSGNSTIYDSSSTEISQNVAHTLGTDKSITITIATNTEKDIIEYNIPRDNNYFDCENSGKVIFVRCGEFCSDCDETDNCISCIDDYGFYEENLEICQTKSEEEQKQYFEESPGVFMFCSSTCETCLVGEDGDNQNCETCPQGNFQGDVDNGLNCYPTGCGGMHQYRYENTNICFKECNPPKYLYELTLQCFDTCPNTYYKIEEEHVCVLTCEGEYPFFVEPIKTCVKECKGKYKYISVEGDHCLEKCPPSSPIVIQGHQCSLSCSEPDIYFDKPSQSCVNNCDNSFYFGEDLMCVNQCEAPYNYKYRDPVSGKNYCTDKCTSPLGYLDVIESECVQNCESTSSVSYLYGNTNKCVANCDNLFPYIDAALNQCVDKCTTPPNLIHDTINKYCVEDCSNNVQYRDTCISSCPPLTINSDGTCILNIDQSGNSHLSKEEIQNNIDNSILDFIEANRTTIKGDDYYFQVYPSNNPPPNLDDVSSIDTSKCEEILREHYNIPLTENFIIAKMDVIIDDETTNQVEYQLYTEDGMKLDMTLCDSHSTQINYPIKDKELIRYDEAYDLYINTGADMYNSKDEFFNDNCFAYSIDNKGDVPFYIRRDNIYHNVTFCEDNCIYEGINFEISKAICNCNTKKNFNTSIHDRSGIANNNNKFNDTLFGHNIIVVKCYMLLFFKWDNIKLNHGFWILLCLNILDIIAILVCFCKEMKQLYSVLHKNAKLSPPPKLNVNVDNDFFDKEKECSTNKGNLPETEREKFSPNLVIANDLSKAPSNYYGKKYRKNKVNEKTFGDLNYYNYNEKYNSEYTNKNTGNYISKDFKFQNYKGAFRYPTFSPFKKNNYNFYLARVTDNRSCCEMYCSILKDKFILIKYFQERSSYHILAVDMIIFIFSLSILFVSYALLFTNSNLDKIFLNEGTLPLTLELWQIIFSIMISLVILVLMNKCVKYDTELFTIYHEIKNSTILGFYTDKLISKMKRNIKIFMVVQLVCMLFFWYYISLFCIAYESTEQDWFRGTIICFVLIVVFNFILCFFSFLFRYVGLVKNKRNVYNIGLFLYKCL